MDSSRRQIEDRLVFFLRIGLAVIFIWFGLLKVVGYNPVFDLIASVLPWLAGGAGLITLGVFETLIGIGLVVNRARPLVHGLLVAHLLGTFLTFVTGLSVVFKPHFPILSLDGEFVIKNMVLAVAGLITLLHEPMKK